MAAMVAIPNGSDDGTMHGCVKKRANQGQLRIVNSSADCRPNETAIIIGGGGGGGVGPAGPPGPAGPGAEPTPASIVELKGPVIGFTNGTTGTVTEIVFPIGLVSGGPVDLTQGTTKVQYDDSSQSITSTTPNRFQTTPVTGADSDLILEADEIFEIRLLDLDLFLDPDLGANTAFRVDVISEFGSVLTFGGATPGSLPTETMVTLKP